ncbi:TatD family hydrolase [bacterium]|nr:TatD family hydrolase [bacterium]
MFDTHAHLSSKDFDEDREKIIKEGITRGVTGIICLYSDFKEENLEDFFKLIENHNFIYGAIGIHPHQAVIHNEIRQSFENSLKRPEIIALGEIGLDYYYKNSSPVVQKEVFRKQLQLAKLFKLPVVIHSRDSMEDTLQIIKEEKISSGVMHCFSGNKEELKKCLELGFYISLSGIVTFPKAEMMKEIAGLIPINRLLLETDAPYLAPQPVRGKRNEPSFIEHTYREVALIRGISLSELEKSTLQNVKDLFNI